MLLYTDEIEDPRQDNSSDRRDESPGILIYAYAYIFKKKKI